MALREEEDFELVLGNRQLFFLAVVLFGVFFSIGYTVGYSRGRHSADAVVAASREPSPPAPSATEPPAAASASSTSEGAPAGDATSAEASTTKEHADSSHPNSKAGEGSGSGSPQETAQSSAAPRTEDSRTKAPSSEKPAGREPAVRESASTAKHPDAESAATRPPAETAAQHAGSEALLARNTTPKTTRAEPARPAPNPPPTSASDPSLSSLPTVSVANIVPGTIYLQVLASKDAAPAKKALLDLKEKGHPVALDHEGGEWYRILVGPFKTREDADAYMVRLKTEGINSFLRKF